MSTPSAQDIPDALSALECLPKRCQCACHRPGGMHVSHVVACCNQVEFNVCAHPQRREIAEPQKNVENKRLLEKHFWWCPDCDDKWYTKRKIGDVDSIEVRINLS